MATRLGDLLLKQGLITTAQLDEALKYQVIFGGKLGTNLIEMGLLEEDEIAGALSQQYCVPTVSADEVMNVAAPVLALLPRELAEQHNVIPLKLEGRRLTLLMPDPSNFNLIDDLAFRTGMIIKPVVAAEVRLILALEKHYNIGRDRRYIHVTKKLATKRPVPPPPVAPETLPLPAAPSAPPATESRRPQIDLEFSLADLAATEELAEIDPLEEILDSQTLAIFLADARDRDDVLDSIASYLAHEYACVALFLVRGNAAHGWKASIDGQELRDFKQAQFPLDEPSVLKTVTETSSFLLGPIPRTPFNSMFLQEIGGRVPQTALLVPLLMMGRVVGIIYVDGKGEELAEKLFELQKITIKAAMAFEILVLKNKIVSM
ncbi:MAG: hypothetical protein U1D97_03160 [Desulfuromonadales bacterium]|nr:hypothetical protein [Desulfuromonadales bacterium]